MNSFSNCVILAYGIDCLVSIAGETIVILCRRNAGHRRANEGKREAANCSNFLPYDGGITYLNKHVQLYLCTFSKNRNKTIMQKNTLSY